MAGQGRRNRSALVLYGSETGTAQDFAGELGSIIERLRFQTHVSSLNTIEPVRGNILLLARLIEFTSAVTFRIFHSRYFHIDCRPRRSAIQRATILEELAAAKVATRLSPRCSIYYIWAWRQLIP